MTFGTGAQAMAGYLTTNWQASRTGRTDLPAAVTDPDTEFGVHIVNDREIVAENRTVHDLIHVYHPEASGLDYQDRGYNEVQTRENLQIDIECTNRNDPDTGERLSARTRMVGDRDAAGFPTDETPPYPGLLGETVYLLESIRRDFEEWDVTRIQPLTIYLRNSNANASIDVELEHVAKNTVV